VPANLVCRQHNISLFFTAFSAGTRWQYPQDSRNHICRIHVIFPVEFISIHAHALLTYVANLSGACVCLTTSNSQTLQLSLRDLSF